MKLKRTTEDYLKTIYILSKTGAVHGAAIAERLGVSRPTVSVSLKALKREGYITQDDSSAVRLTEAGLEIARATYERHQTFQSLLENLGVDGKTAAADACLMEHAVSPESYEAFKELVKERRRKTMNNAMQSFFYGLTSIVFVAAIAAVCSGVRAAMRKIIKGGKNHDD